MSQLADTFGRRVTDLRVSVTDRCNFRCRYCMPAQGIDWIPREELLTYEEMSRFVSICLGLGVDTIRVTGGEPTVRHDLAEFIRQIAALRDGLDIAMTTNAVRLRDLAAGLAAAGLKRVNVSLDSLRRDRFVEITRRDALDAVLDGLDAAAEAGLTPVRVNTVLMRGINDDEIMDFVEFGCERGFEVRFIEFMPLDAGGGWSADLVVPSDEVIETIGSQLALTPIAGDGAEPATRFEVAGSAGSFGVIASVTKPFCQSCDRMRITADGQLRNCLFATDEYDMRSLIRGGASDGEIAEAIAVAVRGKGPGHRIGSSDFVKPGRSMSAIGG